MGGVFISEEILVHNIHIVARTMIDGVLIKKKQKNKVSWFLRVFFMRRFHYIQYLLQLSESLSTLTSSFLYLSILCSWEIWWPGRSGAASTLPNTRIPIQPYCILATICLVWVHVHTCTWTCTCSYGFWEDHGVASMVAKWNNGFIDCTVNVHGSADLFN